VKENERASREREAEEARLKTTNKVCIILQINKHLLPNHELLECILFGLHCNIGNKNNKNEGRRAILEAL
jgi:hypothetical protein